MPYVFVSTQTRLEVGPSTVGDEGSDPQLMAFLGAKLVKQLGNNFKEWRSELNPREILNRLETRGYSLISTTGVGQTCIFTLHAPLDRTTSCNHSSSSIINGTGEMPVINTND